MLAQTEMHRMGDERGVDKRHELVRSAILVLASGSIMYKSCQHPPVTPGISANDISLGGKACCNDDDGESCFDPAGNEHSRAQVS